LKKALELAAALLKTNGQIIPVTLDNVRLEAVTVSGKTIRGEHVIDRKNERIQSVSLVPEALANPKAISKIMESDAIIIGPGDFYTSIMPNLVVDGICNAISNSNAKKIYISNLMSHKNHTDHLTLSGFVRNIESHLGKDVLDFVIYNNAMPSDEFISYYASEGELPVAVDTASFGIWKKTFFVGHNLVSQTVPKRVEGDKLIRGLIRHDPHKTASLIYDIVRRSK
jgi:uncharacterized cofD-like protein